MRIVHVNDLAFVGTTLVRTMRGLGVDAELVRPWRPGAGLPYPWKLAALPLRAAAIAAAGLRLRVEAPDVVHVHYARLGMFGPLAGRPYVLHCHGSDVRGVRPGTLWGREIAPYLAAARVVYYATPDLEPDVTAFRSDAIFLPNPIEIPAERPMIHGPTTDLLVGVRLEAIKGVDTIAAVLRRVVAARPGTTITIVDQGAGVGLVADAAGGRARVIPPVPHEAMAALLQDHRIAVGQFRVGALGNFELEALAAGTPVAASFRYPAAYDDPPPVISGATAEAVADAVIGLLDDEPSRVKHGEAGRAWVSRHHDPIRIATRLLDTYRRILSASPEQDGGVT
ncbi:MAG TPA: glycosyltransferase family 4 protein [Candidatus Limnocylindrales bacterium]|nr:glycosyltransferase family 4 protein [Candidatus Limnocylindrales bacterium]